MDFNRAIVAGRISQAPELRSTSNNQSVTSMGVATNRVWTDREGKKHEDTQFHAVVAWGKLAETAAAFLTKGTTVLVEGRLETRSWQDKDGNTRKITEIIADNIQFGARPAPAAAGESPKAASVAPMEEPVISLDEDSKAEDEDVPF